MESPQAEADDSMLDTSQAGEVLGLKAQTLVQWRHFETGPPFYRFGRQVRYKVADLKEWRDEQMVRPRSVA